MRQNQLDVLVNNAGVVAETSVPFSRIDIADWQAVFRVNTEGTMLGTQAGIEAMKEAGGAIVNIGSIVAGYLGSAEGGAYAASKAAVRSISQSAALSVARLGHDIRVNTVNPTYVWTPLIRHMITQRFGSEEAGLKSLVAQHPLGRLPDPNDIAAAVAFLASEDARSITGSDILVDAGRTIA